MDIISKIKEYAETKPYKIAIIAEEKNVTFKELYKYIKKNAVILQEQGHKKGDSIIIKKSNQYEFITAFLSVIYIGGWCIPIPDDYTEQQINEIKKIVNISNDEEVKYDFELLDSRNKSYETLKHEKGGGIYHATSGTTGKPKLCIRSFQALMSEARSYIETLNMTELDIVLSCAPLSHSFALGATIIPILGVGGTIVTINKLDLRNIMRLVQEKGVSIMFMVPTIAEAFCNVYTKKKYDFSSLRIPLIGAGPISEKLYKQFYDRFGVCVKGNYGSTETGALFCQFFDGPFHSIGKPMAGIEVKICNENGEIVKPGEIGELYVKSEGMLKGYIGEDVLTLDKDGYFAMKDLVLQNNEGYYVNKGRKTLMINIGGKKVNPIEVENVIMEIGCVKECVVIGKKETFSGEEVIAFVVSDEESSEMIRGYCNLKLQKYKVPKRVVFLEKIPKNKIGKVDYVQLQYWNKGKREKNECSSN